MNVAVNQRADNGFAVVLVSCVCALRDLVNRTPRKNLRAYRSRHAPEIDDALTESKQHIHVSPSPPTTAAHIGSKYVAGTQPSASGRPSCEHSHHSPRGWGSLSTTRSPL
eukprot:COSAG05_NODE_895_length_6700_cov_14.354189_3_plen_110_part_00